jgi:hypothetical protein
VVSVALRMAQGWTPQQAAGQPPCVESQVKSSGIMAQSQEITRTQGPGVTKSVSDSRVG